MATHESVLDALPKTTSRPGRSLLAFWARPGAIFYASTMLANAFGYVFFFVMARVLDIAEYGELVTLTALVYVFSVITRSLQAKSAQAVTALRGELGAQAAGAVVLRQMAGPILLGTALIIALGALLTPVISAFLKLDSWWPVIVLVAYVGTHYLLAAPRGVLLGSGRLFYLSWVTVLDPIIRLAVALFLAANLRSTGALLAYVVGNLLAAGVAVLPFVFAPRGMRQLGLNGHAADRPAKTWRQRFSYDRTFLLAIFVNSALMLLASVDPVAVRRLFSETVAGTYAAAFLLGRIILLSTNAASWMVFSRAVLLRPTDPHARKVLLRGLTLGGGIALLVTAGYWVAPDLAALALGGSEYRAAANFVSLVGLEMVLFSFVSILAYYHLALGNMRLAWPFAIALGVEGALLAVFHATPYHVLGDTLITLTGLLLWLAVETARMLPKRVLNRANGHRPRACMIVHSHYPSDPRVRRETEALLEDGWAVDIICVPDEGEAPEEAVGGARVLRMPVRRNRMGSQLSYLMEYGGFLLFAGLRATREHLRQRYHVVQVHNMPDFLVFAALGPKLLGARVVLDVHDLVPEFYSLRYNLALDHRLVRMTRWVQRMSVRFANHVLTAGEPFRRQISRNGVAEERVTSVMNSPDPRLFGSQVARPAGQPGRFVLCYHGTLSEYNDLTVVLRAIHQLRDEIPGLEFHVYGRGRSLPGLKALAAELKLEDRVKFFGFRPLDEMPSVIGSADLGIVPQRRSAFTSLNYPTKAFEYIVSGVPTLMAWSPALQELFGHIDGVLFDPENPNELAERIRRLQADPARAQALVAEQQSVCATFAWATEKKRYVEVMNQLLPAPEHILEPVSA